MNNVRECYMLGGKSDYTRTLHIYASLIFSAQCLVLLRVTHSSRVFNSGNLLLLY